jgi:hypothetical protein
MGQIFTAAPRPRTPFEASYSDRQLDGSRNRWIP